MKQLYLLFFLIHSLQIYSQNELVKIAGNVKTGSLPIENVHILNQNTNIGIVSNSDGYFEIMAYLNDTVLFSSLPFHSKKVTIEKEHLIKKILNVELQIKVNELEEVTVDSKKNTMGVNAVTLKLPNADKTPLNHLDRNLNYYSQAPTAFVILATLLGQKGGIEDIYNIVSGNRKNDRKLKHLLEADRIWEINQEYIYRIRVHFQDRFFINRINIPINKIDSFIFYCLNNNNIIYLFDKGRYLEIMDIFIVESKKSINEDQILHLTKD